MQAVHDGELVFDHSKNVLKVAGMGVTRSFIAQQFAFFGEGLLELDAMVFGHFYHLGPHGPAICCRWGEPSHSLSPWSPPSRGSILSWRSA